MLQHLDMVKCASKVKRFEKGGIIMQEGDSSKAQMYILIKGSAAACINLHQPTEKLVATYKAGDFFGEETVFLGQPPAATLIATEDIISLPLSRDNAAEFFAEQPDATFFLIEKLFRCTRGRFKNTAPAPAKPATASAKPAAAPTAVEPGGLFPPGHKAHQLNIINPNSEYIFMKSYTCPVCGNNFKFLTVKTSKLLAEHTDTDLRVHYSGVEPLHYDVVTCPRCWYSAMTDMFKDCTGSKSTLDKLMVEHRAKLQLKLDESRDSMSIFAGYYLALLCTSKLFRNSEASVGKLWIKVSRLYDDCEDEEMSLYAAEQALKSYMSAYERSNTTGKQNQQLFYIIGELSMRMNDLSTARKFFFQAKTDRNGSPVITRHAEDRIEYLRELSKAQDEG